MSEKEDNDNKNTIDRKSEPDKFESDRSKFMNNNDIMESIMPSRHKIRLKNQLASTLQEPKKSFSRNESRFSRVNMTRRSINSVSPGLAIIDEVHRHNIRNNLGSKVSNFTIGNRNQ